jgi:hypothetical protein
MNQIVSIGTTNPVVIYLTVRLDGKAANTINLNFLKNNLNNLSSWSES